MLGMFAHIYLTMKHLRFHALKTLTQLPIGSFHHRRGIALQNAAKLLHFESCIFFSATKRQRSPLVRHQCPSPQLHIWVEKYIELNIQLCCHIFFDKFGCISFPVFNVTLIPFMDLPFFFALRVRDFHEQLDQRFFLTWPV